MPIKRKDMPSVTPGGFTLIELLIVVAIIAILAAIALPNFLQAQARAKVSRAKADIRSIATALESYCVDHNRYPPENYSNPQTTMIEGNWYTPNIMRIQRLTSPVAYMTQIPREVYPSDEEQAAVIQPPVYHYAARNDPLNPGNLFWWINGEGAGSHWILQGNGPDMRPKPYQYPEYDASNGTRSVGNILRLGP